jgi:hypothetical protein
MDSASQQNSESAASNQTGSSVAKPKPSRSRLMLILIGIVLLAVIGIGIFYSKNNSISKNNSSASSAINQPLKLTQGTPSAPTVAQDINTNWKSFSSNYFGFSHKYPAAWLNDNSCQQCAPQPPIDSSSERYLHPKESTYPTGITYTIDSKNGTSLEIIEKTSKNLALENKKIEDIAVDGYKGIKIDGYKEGAEIKIAVFENKDYVFQLYNHDGFADIFDQILSTFKFTK